MYNFKQYLNIRLKYFNETALEIFEGYERYRAFAEAREINGVKSFWFHMIELNERKIRHGNQRLNLSY